ncbi:hypothetical protein MKX03_018421 [Papaver bracteatum]|nr:hypothetical protein MKX03_018421 [Papaver bracteatum]
MEGGGWKSFTKMIAVVLLIVGTLSGQILASRETEYDACFNKCFDDCTEPNVMKIVTLPAPKFLHWIAVARPLQAKIS